ncbi:MAG: stage II sporulation protein M [Ginsengibacter sp.]
MINGINTNMRSRVILMKWLTGSLLYYDLSYAKIFYPTSKVASWINGIAATIYQGIYQNKKQDVSRILLFWKYELPLLFRRYHKVFLFTFLLSVAFVGGGVLSSSADTDYARNFFDHRVQPGYYDQTISSIRNGDPFGIYKDDNPFSMFVHNAYNNISVAFKTFIFGLLFGVGTVFYMWTNGVILGCFQYLFFAQGMGWQSVMVIWIHGTIEITSIVIKCSRDYFRMKPLIKYIFCVALIGSIGIGCTFSLRRKLPPLTESYRKIDKLPFGSFISYRGFESEFKDYGIHSLNQLFDKTWSEIKNNPGFASGYSLYFLITKNLVLTKKETNAMMQFVQTGNDLFISAEYIDPWLLDAVFCKIDIQNELINEAMGRMDDTFVSMYYGDDFKSQRYGYCYFPFSNYIKSYDSSVTRILGVNEHNLPNYVVLFSGKGRLYLHLAPRAFSNYFLLSKENFEYFKGGTAYLRFEPQYV